MTRVSSAYAGSGTVRPASSVPVNRCTVSRVKTAAGSTWAMARSSTPPAANRGQLVAVAEQRDPHVALVGDGEQRAGGVLVEHAGLVDDEQVPGEQPRGLGRAGVEGAGGRVALPGGQPGPDAVIGPAPAVLEGQPGRRPGRGAELARGDPGRLERRGDHQQPALLLGEEVAGGGEGRGLAGAGRALDHDQRPVPGERG